MPTHINIDASEPLVVQTAYEPICPKCEEQAIYEQGFIHCVECGYDEDPSLQHLHEPHSRIKPDCVSHTIIRVAPENVTKLWTQVKPLIQLGMKDVPTHSIEDVRIMLLGMTAHLWIQWTDRVEAICVTQFLPYPNGCWLLIWLAGVHKECKFDFKGFSDATESFRKLNGCRGREIRGRLGWLKRFPNSSIEAFILRETD